MSEPITEFVDINAQVIGATPDVLNFGTVMGAFDHSATANRLDGPYSSTTELTAAGFDSTSEPEVYAWGATMLGQDNGVNQIYVGRKDVGDADWTATLDAIEAVDSEAFYGVTIESRTLADILLAAAWCETRNNESLKIGMWQTSDVATLDGTAGNIMLQLQAANYTRSGIFYHDTDTGTTGYLDAAAISRLLGFKIDNPGGVGVLAHKPVKIVPYDDLTGGAGLPSVSAANIRSQGGNYNGRKLGLSFCWPGQTPAGPPRFLDITTTIDWFVRRSQEAVLALFVGTPTKVGFNNAGITRVANVIQGVLSRGVTNGHFLGDPGLEPYIKIPDITEITDADKQIRKLRLTSTANKATFDGAIQSLEFNIAVDFASS